MRKYLLFLGLMLAALPAYGQTIVSGTVVDPNSLAYSGASLVITQNGFTIPPNITLSPSGTFTQRLTPGTGYNFTVSFQGVPLPLGTGPQTCSATNQTISGSTQTISFTCPALSNVTGGGGGITPPAGDIGGSTSAPTVVGTNGLTLPASAAAVGTNSSSQIVPVTVATSVFGRTGAVVSAIGDYSCNQVTNCGSTTNPLSQFAATTSAQLFGVLTDPTGTGVSVFANSPSLTTPNIGAATGTSVALGTAPAGCGVITGCLALGEQSSAGTPTTGTDYIRADSATHNFLISLNGGAETAIGTGTGTLTSVATSAPLGGGPITTTGTLTCTTCTTNAAANTSNVLTKGGGLQAIQNSSVTDNGTTVTTTDTGGYVAPVVTTNGTGAGALVMTASSAQGHATASTITEEAPASATAYELTWPTAAATGFPLWTNTSNVVAETIVSTTGTGNVVLQGTPTLTTPNIGAATGTSLSVSGSLTSTVATGTAPIVVTSTTTVPNLTLSNHPKLVFCGTVAACTATAEVSPKIVIGSAALATGAPSTVTITGISPAFTATADYSCTISAGGGTAATNLYGWAAVSSSSFTITGPASVTTVVNYICVGW